MPRPRSTARSRHGAPTLTIHERLRVAARLGSDVPFFLAGGPALVEGRGERVTPLRGIDGAPPGVLLVTPRVAVATADVFAAFDAGVAADRGRRRPDELEPPGRGAAGRARRRGALVDRAGVLASANDLVPATPRRSCPDWSGGPAGAHAAGSAGRLASPGRADPVGPLSFARGGGARRRRPFGRPSPTAPSVRRATDPPFVGRDHQIARPAPDPGRGDMTRHAISTTGRPAAIGPYSQAIVADDFAVLLGPARPRPGERRARRGRRGPGGAGPAQPRRPCWTRPGCRSRTSSRRPIFLADIADFAAINAVYAAHMADPPPARSTFAVGALPKGGRIEIEAIAHRG